MGRVYDVVPDPGAWWDGVTRRWLRRKTAGAAVGETLMAYAGRCAETQNVRLPPFIPSRVLKAKIQEDKEGIPTDQQRAVKAKIQAVKAMKASDEVLRKGSLAEVNTTETELRAVKTTKASGKRFTSVA